jgi:hypothetical protein
MSSSLKFPGHLSRSSYCSNVGRGNSQPDLRSHSAKRPKVNDAAQRAINCNGRNEIFKAKLQRKIEERKKALEGTNIAQIDMLVPRCQVATVQTIVIMVERGFI